MSRYDITDDLEGADSRKAFDEAKALVRGSPIGAIEEILESDRRYFFQKGYSTGRRDMVVAAQALVTVAKVDGVKKKGRG